MNCYEKYFIPNKDETMRLFENNLLKSLSRVNWIVSVLVFSLIIYFFFCRAIFLFGLSIKIILIWFLIGIFVWTFAEYFLHRFVLHFQTKSELVKRLHFLMHDVRQAYPKDSKRLVLPPAVILLLATLFFILFSKILGIVIIAPFIVGFLTGHLFYNITLYAIHRFNFNNKFWLGFKNYHSKHHYQNPKLDFGVSKP